ncbi:hypothetical protein [Flavobacterium sp. FlaQc-50]|jgi:hypothetical protein|uniref:hypothetical protein n=1 Tax=unclassified Flavobacterium TaxID=196869 RepID=UPI0037575771
MRTKTLSKKAETRLIDFFNNTIDRKDMAKVLRQVNYILALGVIKEEGATDLEDNFYWLNELAEVLNPYLDKE